MSTYTIFGDNLVTIPRFDVMFSFSNNRKVMLNHSYMKYFALFCFFSGLKFFWRIFTRSPFYLRKLASNVFSKKLTSEKHILIIGFGDIKSISTTVIDTFIKLGYKIICLYNSYGSETQTKATSLVSEQNLIRCVEIYKEEDFFNDKSTKKLDFEFIIDISFEAIPFIGESKSNINLEKANLKLVNYQKIFEFCLAKKYIQNVKVYHFLLPNKPLSPTNRHIFDTKDVYLENLSKEYKNICIKKVTLNDVKKFTDDTVYYLYKFSDMCSMDCFNL